MRPERGCYGLTRARVRTCAASAALARRSAAPTGNHPPQPLSAYP